MKFSVSWLASQTQYGDGSGEGKAFELGCAAIIRFEANISEYDANVTRILIRFEANKTSEGEAFEFGRKIQMVEARIIFIFS
jgi:hypothetical protein